MNKSNTVRSTFGPEAISLDAVLTIVETALTLNTTDLEPEDITFMADVVVSTLLTKDLLNEHRP